MQTDDDELREERAELAAHLADAMPALKELSQARVSMLDEDDVIIKVTPGRAAWVLSRIRLLMEQLERSGGDGG